LNLHIPHLTPNDHKRLIKCHKRKYPQSNNDFVSLLEEDISNCLSRMENSSEKHYSAREDDITGELVGNLFCLGYDASEQTKKNGAVDLTVKTEEFKWIAEAKRGTSHLHIFEGFLQLLTRYVKQDENAGILIYYQKKGAITQLKNFIEYLSERKWSTNTKILEHSIAFQEINELFLEMKVDNNTDYSFELHTKGLSGGIIRVKVFCANFYFNPVDKSGKNAQVIQKENARLRLMELHHFWQEMKYENFKVKDLDDVLSDFFQFENGDFE
jgi:hypothetical protein